MTDERDDDITVDDDYPVGEPPEWMTLDEENTTENKPLPGSQDVGYALKDPGAQALMVDRSNPKATVTKAAAHNISDQDEIRLKVEETVKALTDSFCKKPEAPKEQNNKPEFSFEDLRKAFYLNEYGDADIAITVFKNRFVYDNSTEEFYRFNKHRWHRCLNREQESAFREIADIYSKEASACSARMQKAEKEENNEDKKFNKKWNKNFNDRARTLRGQSRMRNILNMATAGDNSLGISGEDWNLDRRLLPAANGVIDLETGKLRDGRYNDWFSFGSPVEYKGYHYGGEFVPDFLNKLLRGKKETIEYFKYFLGFACTGIQTKDFFVAYGPTSNNGKSILFNWVSRVLGDFAANVPVELIYEDRFGRDPDKPSPQLLRFRGLRLAVMSEPAKNKWLSVAKVKDLTSTTDKMGARNLREKRVSEFWPTHTLLMHGNEVPTVIGHQGPFYDRLRMFPFHARFVKNNEEVDESRYIFKQMPRVELEEVLKKHDTELLSFLVRCARMALDLGDMPPPPEEVIKETKAFRDEEDLVGRYLRQCTREDPNSEEQAKDLYRSFCYFCKEELGMSSGNIPSQKAISGDLRSNPHIQRIESRTVSYRGVEILKDWIPPSDWK